MSALPSTAPLPEATPESAADASAPQRVVKVRRDYNTWVARETMEDYALRFTPRGFRKWGEWRVAHTAFGAASFLILEAVGATLLVQHGFVNAALAILATGLVIFLAGWPISVYAARHGVDMDLLTRGAGFGYLGSTITSLIYASFTFIFFALEAAVMAYALELAFDIPPVWGYLICALVVIPLVTHGVTAIGRLQVWTQPLWLAMLVLPFIFVFQQHPGLLAGLSQYGGEAAVAAGQTASFNLIAFGAATTVGIALITQMGEQVDYLRFMPEPKPGRRGAACWWAAIVLGGPGWVVLGVVKMLAGMLLAYLALTLAVPADRAVDPNQMYLAAWESVFSHYGWAVAATALFVIVSQLKINVTNAYAGSLAWSNFFSRLTHSHPGRVVWMVFNTGIALVLMEMNVFQALGQVLGLYANVAIAWMMAVVADLVVNKPLGLSPRGIEFRRAYLYDINPVGVGAMGIATVVSVAAHLGAFGPMAQAFSALIALVTAFVASPLIAWATRGRYYLARPCEAPYEAPPPPRPTGRYLRLAPVGRGAPATLRCTVCERDYEAEDMAGCPAYGGAICSLCCTLDARCDDLCKPHARLATQWRAALSRLLPARLLPYLDSGLAQWLLLMGAIVPALALLLALLHQFGMKAAGAQAPQLAPLLASALWKAGFVGVLVAGIAAWWMVLAQRSRQVAQEESNRQTQALQAQQRTLQQRTDALQAEAESHRRTDAALQEAKRIADAANQAKSRYLTAISHELRTPLNSILGYAQLLEEAPDLPAARREAVRTIRRGGDHLLGLIEGTLDIERIEGGRLRLDVRPVPLPALLRDVVQLIEPEALARGLQFEHPFVDGAVPERLPAWVRADDKRLRQILLNLLGNAAKFTRQGRIALRVQYAREMARFDIEDTGPGMDADELDQVFEPFVRGASAGGSAGIGLGLTIAKMLTSLMGGELTVRSTPGQGTCFSVRLFLPAVQGEAAALARPRPQRIGYGGARRRILVVDNEEADRRLMADLLQPLGFDVVAAPSGEQALRLLAAPAAPPVDAILLDLAMPGLDGWQTLRRLRTGLAKRTPVAIVSANAFDKGLDNDLGVRTSDFFVKPVRRDDLLDWLGLTLRLSWRLSSPPPAAEAAPAPPAGPMVRPAAERLGPLQAAVRLGHLRGVMAALDALAASDDGATLAPFIERLRTLARGFRFDAIDALLRADSTAPPAAAAGGGA